MDSLIQLLDKNILERRRTSRIMLLQRNVSSLADPFGLLSNGRCLTALLSLRLTLRSSSSRSSSRFDVCVEQFAIHADIQCASSASEMVGEPLVIVVRSLVNFDEVVKATGLDRIAV